MTVETNEPWALEFRLFGTFDVRVKGRPLPPLRYRKERWLLALLALRQDHDVPRDWLAATFWPDNEESQALFYLRKALSNLRNALGDEASRLQSPTSRTLRMDLEGAFVDALAFDAAVSGLAMEAVQERRLEEAVRLYRGPLLQGCSEEWVLSERQAREQSYLAALERLATLRLEQGEPAPAVRWLRLLVAADPYRESAYGALMQALADSGDRAAMEQVYQDLRRVLRRDLNASSSPEIEALYRSLCTREIGPIVLPLASSTPDTPPRRLPVPLSDLIGREAVVEEVGGWLGRSRLVTLVGAGGVGKTRLAIAVAERVMNRFAGGVWFADLAPLRDPAQIAPTILRLLDVPEEPQSPLEQILERALYSRTLLLVLDNCEHLLDTCAVLTHRLLSVCSGLRILSTSREALGLTGEHLYRVPSLPLPPLDPRGGEKDASSLLEYAAVRLFVERARQAHPTFQLNRSQAGAVAQICRHLDGIPLAVEMAAARVKALPVAQIAARLDDRFRLLTGGNRAALPRQRTLQATIDWSHDLLSEAERILFRRLSIFSGGWTLEAAEAVCDFRFPILDFGFGADATAIENPKLRIQNEGVLDVLASLVEKSLVTFEESVEGSSRYRLLETLRQYGTERLAEAGETVALRNRHCAFFLQWAEEAEPHFYGPEQSAWYATVEHDLDNLRAALEWCQCEKDAEKALRLAGALSPFWDVRGYFTEGLAYLDLALSQRNDVGTSGRAKALHAAGQLSARQGEYLRARSLLEEGLAIRRDLGDSQGSAWSLSELAHIALHQGDYALATSLCEESLAISQALGDKRRMVGSLNELGHMAFQQSNYAQARSLYQECLAIQRAFADGRGIAGSLNNLGLVAFHQGEYLQARSLVQEGLAIFQELGDRRGIAWSLRLLGRVALHQGDYALALSLCEESLTISQELGDKATIDVSLNELMNMALNQGDYAQARALCEKCLAISRMGNRLGIIHALGGQGHVARAEGDYERACALYTESLALRRELGDAYLIALSLEDFASLAGRQGQRSDAAGPSRSEPGAADPRTWSERAVRLLGASEALCRTFGKSSPVANREEFQRTVDTARIVLGDEAFAGAWEQGRGMTMEQAIEYARTR